LMNSSLFLSFFELSVGLYILGSILFSIVLSNYRSYGFPTLLSSLSTFSIFILTSLLFLILNLGDSCFTSFYGLVNLSPFNCFFLILLLISTCFILILNKNYYSTHGLYQYEFDILLIFSVLGLIILCLSNDFLLVYMGIELQSLAFYVLATFKRNSEFNNEAGLKYFILGSFSSCLLLIGFSFFYLALGSTSFDILFKLSENRDTFNLVSFAFVLTMVAFFFKVGAAPFHM
jgi:NADH-quinone oxidoreductase subunit N